MSLDFILLTVESHERGMFLKIVLDYLQSGIEMGKPFVTVQVRADDGLDQGHSNRFRVEQLHLTFWFFFPPDNLDMVRMRVKEGKDYEVRQVFWLK